MFLICEKYNDEIICICKNLDYMENGYPRDIDRNIAYVKETVNVYSDVDVAESITEYKYCYNSEKGFYENPNYNPPEDLKSKVDKLEKENEELKKSIQAILDGANIVTGGMTNE